jgi:hypothetical protein
MKYDRALPTNVDIEVLLEELMEYFDDRVDVDHNGIIFTTNAEGRFSMEIQQALYQLERQKKPAFYPPGMPFGRKDNEL